MQCLCTPIDARNFGVAHALVTWGDMRNALLHRPGEEVTGSP